jgi:hypothetical protein
VVVRQKGVGMAAASPHPFLSSVHITAHTAIVSVYAHLF